MNSIVDFIVGWKDLITKVFGEHPLAAALVTIVAVAVFVLLDREVRKGKRPTNLMIVLVGWAVAVPIVGFVMTILSKVWAFIEAVAPIITSALGSFYRIYERHPLLVAILSAVGLAAYFLWRKFRPKLVPSNTLRIVAVTAAVVLAAHVASPVADWLAPSSASEANVDTKAKQTQRTGSTSTPTPASVTAPSSTAVVAPAHASATAPAAAQAVVPSPLATQTAAQSADIPPSASAPTATASSAPPVMPTK